MRKDITSSVHGSNFYVIWS